MIEILKKSEKDQLGPIKEVSADLADVVM